MRALIVDDEPISRRVLREELEAFPEVQVIGEAGDGRDALQRIGELRPDLVFLDLQMPVMSGLEVVQSIRQAPLPIIVIVTAFDQHAIEAFEAGAIDYLLKPISEARLRTTVERARGLLGKPGEIAARVEKVAASMQPPGLPRSRKVVGRSGDDYFVLDLDEVLAFQAERELVWIITGKQRLLSTQTLRVHRSASDRAAISKGAPERHRQRQPRAQDKSAQQPALADYPEQRFAVTGKQAPGA